MRRRTIGAVLLLASAGWLAAEAKPVSALTCQPGQALEIPFSMTGTAAGADTLTFRLVNVTATGVSTMTVELWDGALLVAAVSNVPTSGIAGFVDAGSLWTTNAVSAVLDSVRAGTIAGRIRVLPNFDDASSLLTADVSPITSFAVGHGADASTITPIDGVLAIGTARTVPETQ